MKIDQKGLATLTDSMHNIQILSIKFRLLAWLQSVRINLVTICLKFIIVFLNLCIVIDNVFAKKIF